MKRTINSPLHPLFFSNILRGCVCALLFSASFSMMAQEPVLSSTSPEYNKNVRTNTWSIYAQGGLSWATDIGYENINARQSYKLSPAVGGGIDFTIRPWVRIGADYLWSRYRGEQRLSVLDTDKQPLKAYSNYLMNYHNAKLGVQFNALELWPRRKAQWLNLWAGTGVGYTFAKGNEYTMEFNNTITQGGVTTPFTNGMTIAITVRLSSTAA